MALPVLELTVHVDQAYHKLTELPLPLSLSAGITGICRYA